MKKKLFLCLFLFTVPLSTAHALDWAYQFVVWKGNVYEVKHETPLDEEQIGKYIGRVNTSAHPMTGEYYGNASNAYPIGTKYYEIKDVPTSEAIAIQVDDHWLEAVFVDKAPAHILNIIGHPLFYMLVVILIIAILSILAKQKKE